MGESPGPKLALVFSGGGAKGAFGVGVLRGLLRHAPDLTWDIVSGTSTGALITPLAALHPSDPAAVTDLEALYRGVRKKDIVESNVVWHRILCLLCRLPRGWHHARPLRRLIRRNLPSARLGRLRESPVAAIVNAVSLQTGELILCTQETHRQRLEAWFDERRRQNRRPVRVRFLPFDQFPEAMVASSAIPGAIEPVLHRRPPQDGGGREELVDGGVIDIAPLRAAIAAGATHLVAILMSPLQPPPEERPFDNLVKVAFRSVDLLTDEVLRGDVEDARQVNRLHDLANRILADAANAGGEVREWMKDEANLKKLRGWADRRPLQVAVIEPPMPLGDTLDFDSTVPPRWPGALGEEQELPIMEARYRCGVKAAAKAIETDPVLRGILEAFRRPSPPPPAGVPARASEPQPSGPV
jgi:predicted acylesterase/phospholipase RssA